MGAIYMAGLILRAGLTLFSGPLSDGCGRKPFLLAYGVARVLATTAALCSSAPIVLVPAAIIGACGRAANGAAGPFGPAGQAWLLETELLALPFLFAVALQGVYLVSYGWRFDGWIEGRAREDRDCSSSFRFSQ
jgi:hypothetical protein